mgnify:CR=1 FL=1
MPSALKRTLEELLRVRRLQAEAPPLRGQDRRLSRLSTGVAEVDANRPLPAVQRAYFYLVALVAVHMVVLAVANLLRVGAELARPLDRAAHQRLGERPEPRLRPPSHHRQGHPAAVPDR